MKQKRWIGSLWMMILLASGGNAQEIQGNSLYKMIVQQNTVYISDDNHSCDASGWKTSCLVSVNLQDGVLTMIPFHKQIEIDKTQCQACFHSWDLTKEHWCTIWVSAEVPPRFNLHLRTNTELELGGMIPDNRDIPLIPLTDGFLSASMGLGPVTFKENPSYKIPYKRPIFYDFIALNEDVFQLFISEGSNRLTIWEYDRRTPWSFDCWQQVGEYSIPFEGQFHTVRVGQTTYLLSVATGVLYRVDANTLTSIEHLPAMESKSGMIPGKGVLVIDKDREELRVYDIEQNTLVVPEALRSRTKTLDHMRSAQLEQAIRTVFGLYQKPTH